MVITVTSFLGINQQAWGQIDKGCSCGYGLTPVGVQVDGYNYSVYYCCMTDPLTGQKVLVICTVVPTDLPTPLKQPKVVLTPDDYGEIARKMVLINPCGWQCPPGDIEEEWRVLMPCYVKYYPQSSCSLPQFVPCMIDCIRYYKIKCEWGQIAIVSETPDQNTSQQCWPQPTDPDCKYVCPNKTEPY